MIGRLLKARYELVGLLQDSPIFATYAARDKIQGRDISIRVVKPPFGGEQDFVDRLAMTVQKYGVIQSANVERLQSVETDDGIPFVIGDLTRGPSLADRIRKLAPFSIPVSVGTAISILHALDAIHRSGLVHGDLNPQNLAVMADGDVRLQLTGVWEAYSASPTAGVVVLPGMAPYLAPEVSAGAMPSSSSDVYAVGILLYELILGQSPYHADTPLAMALQHSTAPTPSLRAVSLAVPVVLDEIVKKAMAKDPRARYSTAGEMFADLRMLQDALRFGRSLSWPLRPDAVEPGPQKTGKGPSSRPQPVAPRMSAIRKTPEVDPEQRPTRKERDVPLWMWLIFTVGCTLFVVCLGMWIVQNLSKPVWVTVTKIQTLSVADATNVLKESKLRLRVARRRPSDKVPQDAILEVDPEAGQKIREGGQVSVIVSSGSRYVAVPLLEGLTVDKAKALLAGLNLELSDNVTNLTDAKIPAGMIIRSEPAAKTLVERQSQIRIVVSLGPKEQPASSPIATGDGYVFNLHLNLKYLTGPTKVRIDMIDERGVTPIYEKMHNSGDTFDVSTKGQKSQATFNIYYDGVLVKSVDKDTQGQPSTDESIQPDTASTGGDGQ